MIWLIGNRGMLGTEVEALLQQRDIPYFASDKEVDITDTNMLQQFVTDKLFTWIINCSAYTAVDKAEDETEIAYRINADGPRNLAEIARSKNAKLIHISTDYVFDGTKEEAYTETDAPNPLGVYGKSKYQGEVNIRDNLEKFFILRTSWLYGKHGNNFVYTMLRLFTERNMIRIVGDQYGSPTYAPDLAEAILEIVSLNSKVYGIYNFANEGRISWYDFACAIYLMVQNKGLLSKDVRIQRISTEEYPTKALRPGNSYLSIEKIRQSFNIRVRPWQEGLQDFFVGMDVS